MNSTKLTPALLLLPFALATLACPTRPIDRDTGSGGGGGEAGGALAGAGGNVGGRGGGEAGAAGSAAGVAGAVAGAAGGGVAGAAGGPAGASGAGGPAGNAGGMAGATSGTSGAAGGMMGLGGAAGTNGGLEDGQPCSLATNCASHTCTGFYVDVDGDGYGTGQAVGFCGTTAPVGYASQSGDCCDSATNLSVAKLIHPGADFQTTSAGGVCGITWDYNCSGAIEQEAPMHIACTPYPDCGNVTGSFPDSDCGQSVNLDVCKINTGTAMCYTMTGLSNTLKCR